MQSGEYVFVSPKKVINYLGQKIKMSSEGRLEIAPKDFEDLSILNDDV